MATAPEIFNYSAPSAETESMAVSRPDPGAGALMTMIRLGAVGAAIAVAGVFLLALAEARLADEAFVRLVGWY